MHDKPQLQWRLDQLAQVVPDSLEEVLTSIIDRLDRIEFTIGIRSNPPSGDFLPSDNLTQ